MTIEPFAYGNDFFLLVFTPEGDRLRCRCSCGWKTESAAPAWMVDRAKDAHLDDAHPRIPQYVRRMPVDYALMGVS